MTARLTPKSGHNNNGIPYNMFVASVVLHLIAIAAVILTVPGASRQLTFGAPYSVALVGPEVMSSTREISNKGLLQSFAAPDQPVILKSNSSSTEKVAAVHKTDTSRLDIEKAISALRQKEQDDQTGASQPVAPTAGGSASTDQNRTAQNDYSRFVWSKVKKNWTLPASLIPKNNVETVIELRIAQSGAVEYIGFEKRSGHHYFDESAMRAVKKSMPFPPVTGWPVGRLLEIGIRFHSAELR